MSNSSYYELAGSRSSDRCEGDDQSHDKRLNLRRNQERTDSISDEAALGRELNQEGARGSGRVDSRFSGLSRVVDAGEVASFTVRREDVGLVGVVLRKASARVNSSHTTVNLIA